LHNSHRSGRGSGVSVAEVLPFLNRVSDAMFVFSRWLNARHGAAEVIWTGRGSR
jgi:cob(I)alamin adenosyltransferase